MIIDGKKVAAELREELKKKVADLKSTYNAVPGLTVILVGEDIPSKIYVKNKEKSAIEVGINSEVIRYPANLEEKALLDKIKELNKNNKVSGILVQLPLPKHIDKRKVIETIDHEKDVDGFHPMNVGNLSSGYDSSIPCTPLGCSLLLKKVEKNLSGKRENKLSVNSWRKIYKKVQKDCSKIHQNLTKTIEKNLDEIENNWPKNIPSGIIHADLFPDNIFFKDGKLTGIIDFYFSCYDFYVFEIAICLNALCFEGQKENLSFNVTKAKKFVDGYSSIRKLTEEEKKSLKILCQGAAMRFLLTRVFDYLNLTEGALVKIKDPIEYLKRLEFHNSVKDYKDYFF